MSAHAFVCVAAEPTKVVLKFDRVEVGLMDIDQPERDMRDQETLVQLGQGQAYSVNCVVTGGNPVPNITLSSGNMQHTRYQFVPTTDRDVQNAYSVPTNMGDATLSWTPTVADIGRPFVCAAGVEEPRAVWTSFVPIVADSKQYSAMLLGLLQDTVLPLVPI